MNVITFKIYVEKRILQIMSKFSEPLLSVMNFPSKNTANWNSMAENQ